jgi:hypothetical protein
MNIDPLSFILNSFGGSSVDLVVKIVVLIFISLVGIFAFILFNQTRSLNKIILLRPAAISSLPVLLTTLFLLATVSLFLLALAIL